jgi:hypothetical protein
MGFRPYEFSFQGRKEKTSIARPTNEATATKQ